MSNFFYSIQAFFEWTFTLMVPIANVVNYSFIIIIAILGIYWIRQLIINPEKKQS